MSAYSTAAAGARGQAAGPGHDLAAIRCRTGPAIRPRCRPSAYAFKPFTEAIPKSRPAFPNSPCQPRSPHDCRHSGPPHFRPRASRPPRPNPRLKSITRLFSGRAAGPRFSPIATRDARDLTGGPTARLGCNLPARFPITLRTVITTVRPRGRPAGRTPRQARLSRRNFGTSKYPVTCGVRA